MASGLFGGLGGVLGGSIVNALSPSAPNWPTTQAAQQQALHDLKQQVINASRSGPMPSVTNDVMMHDRIGKVLVEVSMLPDKFEYEIRVHHEPSQMTLAKRIGAWTLKDDPDQKAMLSRCVTKTVEELAHQVEKVQTMVQTIKVEADDMLNAYDQFLGQTASRKAGAQEEYEWV